MGSLAEFLTIYGIDTPVSRVATGGDPSAIADTVENFQDDLGGDSNGGDPVPAEDGFRSINWDAIPDGRSAPNNLPGNFFDASVSPRSRGLLFSNPTTAILGNLGSFQVSADSENPTSTPIEFANIDATYPDEFQPFSSPRLFATTNGNVINLEFSVPGTGVPATVNSFGAVFADVDLPNTTKIEFLGANGELLSEEFILPADKGLSFRGETLPKGREIASVRLTLGNSPFGTTEDPAAGIDVVALDDFIYSEPQAIAGLEIPTIRQATGATTSDIQSTVDSFRADLGGDDRGGEPTGFPDGQRSINWDGIPAGAIDPLTGNFFNTDFAPRARGIEFSTPGTGFQVSAASTDGTSVAVEFGNINSTYPDELTNFSAERLFTPTGSNVVVINFFVPGTNTPATVKGFGAVFTDVDLFDSTTIAYFDADGQLLNADFVPPEDKGLSFRGISYEDSRIASVAIVSGNTAIGPNDNPSNGIDIVAIDDFIYGEPQAIG